MLIKAAFIESKLIKINIVKPKITVFYFNKM